MWGCECGSVRGGYLMWGVRVDILCGGVRGGYLMWGCAG